MREPHRLLTARLLELIETHPEGLRLDEVQARTRVEGCRAGVDDLAAALLDLQHQGLAHINAARRWFPKRAASVRPSSAVTGSDDVAGAGLVLQALPARITGNDMAVAPAPALSATGTSLKPTWGLLRSLLPYYAEALARNERALLLGTPERYGEQFLLVAPRGRWWPAAGLGYGLELSRTHLPVAFLTALARRTREPIHVAYPIALVRPRDAARSPFLLPVATVAADWTLDAEKLRLNLPAQTPAIEWSWVRGQRQRGRQIRELLDALDVNADDEVWRAGSFVDWATFVDRLAATTPTEVRTPLDLAQPNNELDCGQAGGIYGALGLFLSSELQFARGAVRDLKSMTQWSDDELATTALAACFSDAIHKAPNPVIVPVLEPLVLGEDQLAAVRAGLNDRLTVVTGPPGTGKSQVAVALMASAALVGRSVLFASRNHQAIDAVVGRLAEVVEDRPLVIRANARESDDSFDFTRAIEAILARPGGERPGEGLAGSIEVLTRLDAARTAAIEQAATANQAINELGRLEAAIGDLTAALGIDAAAPLPRDLPAATRPLHSWLERLFAPWVRYRRLQRLRRLALGWGQLGFGECDESTLELHEQRLLDLQELAALRVERDQAEAAVRQLRSTGDPIALGERLCASSKLRLQGLAELLIECAPEDRRALTALRGDLALARGDGAAGAARARELWSAQRALILGQMPLWAVSNLGAASRIPLVPGLFDYVVLDEASQCDIASALPLLARARQAIVIGDPAQLTHISQVRREWEAETLRNAGLMRPGIGSYLFSTNSLFHLAAAAAGDHHLLRDHFRCHEDIADYISATFYGNRLRPLTDPRSLRAPVGQAAGFHWTTAPGPIQPARTGCFAPAEIEAIVHELHWLLGEGGFTGSIGVVTSFREQANRLRDRIEHCLSAEAIASARLEVHTAHGFQGDARDVILLSLCIGPDMPAGARAFLHDTGNLVNVAVSRARAVCHIFGNLEYGAHCGIRYVEALLARRHRTGDATASFESPWEEKLWRALAERGIETTPQYPIAGRRLDLALLTDSVRLDIEVDGDRFHRDLDGRRKVGDLWRDHQLQALGWRVVRFWVYELRENMDGCVERILVHIRSTDY
ncbi:AAA domain-containing protein [Plasticicumulans lactativorans]|uniref:AAA domain-containing protein n=1 Tax=Plasticicumulans lactativorans TaxID=1133106 RepID=UPI001404BDEC|nr:AAA domain-containing protein [Plasticicumulans lactativorans]